MHKNYRVISWLENIMVSANEPIKSSIQYEKMGMGEEKWVNWSFVLLCLLFFTDQKRRHVKRIWKAEYLIVLVSLVVLVQ